MQCNEAKSNSAALQKKSSNLEHELVQSHQRSQQLSDENKELFKTVGALRKQIGRLDVFKTAVHSSIQDHHEKEHESGDTRALMSDEYIRSAAPLTSRELGLAPAGPRHGQSNSNLSSSFPQIHEPMSPQRGAGQGRPISPVMDVVSAARGGGPTSPVIDGKAFFRQARSQLSY